MPAALAIPAILGAAGVGASIFGSVNSSNAANDAAQLQYKSAEDALQFQKDEFSTQQQNIAPWLSAGKQSLGTLMGDFQNGTFGPGSIQAPGAFKPPSLQDARNSPGYQFELGQGISAIQRSAAARGGLGSGSTLKGLESFGTGLADSTYGDVFNRSLATYGAGLQGYQAQLAGQSQAYNELAGISGTGQNAAQSINSTGTQVAQNVGSLMTQQGNALAGGVVGSANGINQGVSGATGSLLQSVLLGQMMNQGGMGQTGTYSPSIGNGGAPIPNNWGGDGSPSYTQNPYILSLGGPG